MSIINHHMLATILSGPPQGAASRALWSLTMLLMEDTSSLSSSEKHAWEQRLRALDWKSMPSQTTMEMLIGAGNSTAIEASLQGGFPWWTSYKDPSIASSSLSQAVPDKSCNTLLTMLASSRPLFGHLKNNDEEKRLLAQWWETMAPHVTAQTPTLCAIAPGPPVRTSLLNALITCLTPTSSPLCITILEHVLSPLPHLTPDQAADIVRLLGPKHPHQTPQALQPALTSLLDQAYQTPPNWSARYVVSMSTPPLTLTLASIMMLEHIECLSSHMRQSSPPSPQPAQHAWSTMSLEDKCVDAPIMVEKNTPLLPANVQNFKTFFAQESPAFNKNLVDALVVSPAQRIGSWSVMIELMGAILDHPPWREHITIDHINQWIDDIHQALSTRSVDQSSLTSWFLESLRQNNDPDPTWTPWGKIMATLSAHPDHGALAHFHQRLLCLENIIEEFQKLVKQTSPKNTPITHEKWMLAIACWHNDHALRPSAPPRKM